MARQDYGDWLKGLYGMRVQKLNVNAGFSCPNRDGTLAHGGCSYCNNSSFTPAFGVASRSVTQQLADGKDFYAGKYAHMKYLAYFQSFTGTYASISRLRELYIEALDVDDVVGLVVSTRPDCIADDVLDLLCCINEHHRVIVELGVETTHDVTLQRINRCHSWQCARDAILRVAKRGLKVGAHMILGLPGESLSDMMTSANAIAQLPLDTVKFHQLQVLKGTELAQQWNRGELQLQHWSATEYAAFCHQVISILPQHIVIERMVSTAPRHLLLYPQWGLKPHQFNALFTT